MKKCFKCGQEKERTEFYKHPQMGDGLLGKCKECTKSDTAKRHAEKANDPDWLEKERERHRLKSQRYTSMGVSKEVNRRFLMRKKGLPEDLYFRRFDFGSSEVKKAANTIAGNAIRDGRLVRLPCQVCGKKSGVQGHHEDYSKPVDVVWLCTRHHADRHVHLNAMATLGAEPMAIHDFINHLKQVTP